MKMLTQKRYRTCWCCGTERRIEHDVSWNWSVFEDRPVRKLFCSGRNYISHSRLSAAGSAHWRKNWAIPCLSEIKESVMWSWQDEGEPLLELHTAGRHFGMRLQEEALLSNEKSFYVASVGSLLAFMLPTVFQEFIRNTPECSLHVTTLHSSEAYSYVNNKTVDIAFITDPMYSSQVKTEVLFKEKLCLIVEKIWIFPQHQSLRAGSAPGDPDAVGSEFWHLA